MNLLASGGVQPIHQSVPPPRRRAADAAGDFAYPSVTRRTRDGDDRWRTVLATAVVCTGVFVAVIALWQARTARTVYVLVPGGSVPPAVATASVPTSHLTPATSYSAPVVSSDQWDTVPAAPVRPAAAAPARMTPAPMPTPTPVDYAACDRRIADLKRQIDNLDETVRRVRADPHWYGLIKGSTDTSRQQASDAYLAELDRQRNDLRRQKWALEGR